MDNLCLDGARRLSAVIRDNWRRRGVEPVLRVVPQITSRNRESVWVIRSNMLNGCPQVSQHIPNTQASPTRANTDKVAA